MNTWNVQCALLHLQCSHLQISSLQSQTDAPIMHQYEAPQKLLETLKSLKIHSLTNLQSNL